MSSYPASITTQGNKHAITFTDIPGVRVMDADPERLFRRAEAALLDRMNSEYIAKHLPVPMPSFPKEYHALLMLPPFEWMKVLFYNTLLAEGKISVTDIAPLVDGFKVGELKPTNLADLVEWIHVGEMQQVFNRMGKKFEIRVV